MSRGAGDTTAILWSDGDCSSWLDFLRRMPALRSTQGKQGRRRYLAVVLFV